MKSRYDKGPEGVDQSEVWTKVERSDVTQPWTAGLAGLIIQLSPGFICIINSGKVRYNSFFLHTGGTKYYQSGTGTGILAKILLVLVLPSTGTGTGIKFWYWIA